MRDQAQTVSWLIEDRDRANEDHMGMLVQKSGTSCAGGKGAVLARFGGSLEHAIYDAAAPKPHPFT